MIFYWSVAPAVMALFYKKGLLGIGKKQRVERKYHGFEYLIIKLSFLGCHGTPA